MPEFLSLLPPGEALQLVLRHLHAPHPIAEEIETAVALGRCLAEDIQSPESLPAFARSTVDGYAVRSSDTFGASDSLPSYLTLAGEVPMGGQAAFQITRGQAALIHTGGMLPEGSDAVVMLEHSQLARPGELEVLRPAAHFENVIQAGEDLRPGDLVLPAGQRLRPAEIGGLLALGITRVHVARQPQVAIISSGDEVIPPDLTPLPGQVRDINSYSLSALVQQSGGSPRRYGILPDREDVMRETLGQALEQCDAVVVTAGSSASARDLTARAIQSLGTPGVLVHGVNLRPGKPTILAVCAGKPVIGLPGNPVSALVVARLFVVPLIAYLLGSTGNLLASQVVAVLNTNLPSQAGREDWIPAKLTTTPQGYLAEPIFFKSNLIFTLARADGLIYIPADATGLSAGERVQVFLLE